MQTLQSWYAGILQCSLVYNADHEPIATAHGKTVDEVKRRAQLIAALPELINAAVQAQKAISHLLLDPDDTSAGIDAEPCGD